MPEENQESASIRLVHEAEQNADVYREALLEMSLENDQLYNDYCKVYDKMVRISARIVMANSCLSSLITLAGKLGAHATTVVED
jgi:hypothetical protein